MRVEGNETVITSWMGTLLTVILSIIMLIFFYTKFNAWNLKKDVDIMSSIIENNFDYNYRFSTK